VSVNFGVVVHPVSPVCALALDSLDVVREAQFVTVIHLLFLYVFARVFQKMVELSNSDFSFRVF